MAAKPTSRLKIILYAVGGLLGFLVLAALAAVFFVDINAYKSRVETIASSALGMDARVGGQVGIGLFPSFHITLEDVHVRNRGTELGTAKEADLEMGLLSLLRGKVRLGKITLTHARISIERDLEGKYNYEQTEEAKGAAPVLYLPAISLPDGSLVYTDKKTGGGFEATDCSMDVSQLRHPGGERTGYLKQLSLTAEAACGALMSGKLRVSDLKFSLDGKKGVFNFEPVTMSVFGGEGSGNIKMDRTAPVQQATLNYALKNFNIGEYFKIRSPNKIAEGMMDFSAKLSMRGNSRDELVRTANGEAVLKGDKLTLYGTDLDKELAQYKSSQNFNLVDLSAFFFAGPIGLSITKGREFGELLRQSGGSSEVRTLVSKWKVDNGVARATDVAMATNENRLALQGGLNFVSETYEDVTVAVVDSKGCAKVTQKIHGPFPKPEIDKPDFLMALAGPMLNLLNRAKKLLSKEECTVFYSGSVPAPK